MKKAKDIAEFLMEHPDAEVKAIDLTIGEEVELHGGKNIYWDSLQNRYYIAHSLFFHMNGGINEDNGGIKQENSFLPMDTAPKDGTSILIKDSDDDVLVVCWDYINVFNREPLDERDKDWVVIYSDDESGNFIVVDTIGWKPLPK